MNSQELVDKLKQYEGQHVRITSHVRGDRAGVLLEPGCWPMLIEAKLDSQDAAWIHTDDGVWQVVVNEGLVIELEPVIGTYDLASGRDRMEAVGTAIRRYGPTPREYREQCHCGLCQARHESERARDDGPEFKDTARPKVGDALEPTPLDDTLDISGL